MKNNKILLLAVLAFALIASVVAVAFPMQYDKVTGSGLGAQQIAFCLTYVLFGVALLATLGFALVGILSNIKKQGKILIATGLLAAVLIISILLASADLSPVAEKMETSAGQMKAIGGSLVTVYVLFGVALLSIIAAPIISKLRK